MAKPPKNMPQLVRRKAGVPARSRSCTGAVGGAGKTVARDTAKASEDMVKTRLAAPVRGWISQC
ncbi:hypothetical protein NH8B_2962 [Pseudogulbenkiania sp. NH8B]|nr:hypothetical protein NH8B_2962 [Pseudogulbenkiania sp. NH8B]